MKKLNPYSRITLDVPYIGKITADCYTFNSISYAFGVESESYSKEVFPSLHNRARTISKFIFNELTKRGFYED